MTSERRPESSQEARREGGWGKASQGKVTASTMVLKQKHTLAERPVWPVKREQRVKNRSRGQRNHREPVTRVRTLASTLKKQEATEGRAVSRTEM